MLSHRQCLKIHCAFARSKKKSASVGLHLRLCTYSILRYIDINVLSEHQAIVSFQHLAEIFEFFIYMSATSIGDEIANWCVDVYVGIFDYSTLCIVSNSIC